MTIFDEEPEKPDLEQLVLFHYGVKGMKWGIIRERDQSSGGRHGGKKDDSGGASKKATNKSSSKSSSKKAADKNALDKKYMAIPDGKKKTVEEAKRSLAENHKKSMAKLGKDGKDSGQNGGLTKGQKRAIKWGIVAGGVAGLVVMNKIGYAKALKPMIDLAGKRIPAEQFASHVQHSKIQTWGFGGYIQKSSYARREYELPVGHTFHRISEVAEDSFGPKGTYATHSTEDFHRYVAAFRQEKMGSNLHHVTWTAEKPVKVPSLSTTLETLRESMSKDLGREVTPAEAKKQYERLSGGGWHPVHEKHVGTFFEDLKAKGYGAIVDEMDAGVIGESPIVIIDHSLMSAKSAKPLTAEAIKQAEESLIELTNRKM